VTLVIKQMNDLGIKLTTIGNASIVAQTTLNNLSAAEADGGYAIGGMIPQTSTDAKIMDWSKRASRTNTKCRPTTLRFRITTPSTC
jgi:branched-chain amino acid transport system substrate-binding protein